MNLSELQKKIADVLGVSGSQKELAFEIFVDDVSEILAEGLTLKVPRIGFFQQKINHQKKSKTHTLLFSPLSEDFTHDTRNLYLTIDVTAKSKDAVEYDSNVFSIGVGKPLLPLSIDELPDSETSYTMLKKSIEERVKELIAESDQIPNFNIWDDYYKSSYVELNEEGITHNTLATLTSDLEFNEPEPSIPDSQDIEETVSLLDLLNNENDLTKGNDEIVAEENSFETPLIVDEREIPNEEIEHEDFAANANEEVNVEDAIENTGGKHVSEIDEIILKEIGESVFPQLTIADLLDEPKQEEEIPEQNIVEEPKAEGQDYNESNSAVIDTSVDEETENEKNILDNIQQQPADEIENKKEEHSSALEDFMPWSLNSEEPLPAVEHESKPDETFSSEISSEPEETISLEKILSEEPPKQKEEQHDDQSIPTTDLKTFLDGKETIQEEKKETFLDKLLKDIPEVETPIEENPKLTEDEIVVETTDSRKILEKLLEEPASKKKLFDETGEESADENESLWGEDALKKEEKIEWNWGDELREEFGIGIDSEDASFEMVDDTAADSGEESESELYDGEKKSFSDLFAKLEYTLEQEKTKIFEEEQKAEKAELRETTKEFQNRDSNKIVFKDEEKVFLEFKTPPAKYEFVEAEKPSRATKMAITISHEEEELTPLQAAIKQKQIEPITTEKKRTQVYATEEENRLEKKEGNKFFSTTLLIISSTVVIVAVMVYFFIFYRGAQSNQTILQKETVQNQQPDNKILDQQTANQQQNISQQKVPSVPANSSKQNKSKETTKYEIDDLNDFPRTATPPVPVKNGNDNVVLDNKSTVQAENKQPQTLQNASVSKPESSKPKTKQTNSELYRTLNTDTRVSGKVYYDGKSYNFQVSSWKKKDVAEQEVKRLRSLGYQAFALEAYLPEKGGTWYRVRIGSFKSEKEATDFQGKNNF